MQFDSLSRFVAGLAEKGNRVALIEQDLYRARAYSYADLIGKAFAFRRELERYCIHEGDRVLVWGRAGAAWAVVFYGCLMSGVVVVPIDAALSAEYVQRTLRHTEAKLLCTEVSRAGALRNLVNERVLSFDAIEALPAERAGIVPAIAADKLLEVVYTSGTTAEPKGVMITHGNILANIRSVESEVCKVRRWAKPLLRIGFVHVIPLSHLFGQVVGLLIPPLVEGRVIFPESLAPPTLAYTMRRHHASMLVCVPQQLQLLADWALTQAGDAEVEGARQAIGKAGEHWLTWRFWHWRKLRRQFGWRMWAFLVGGASLPRELEDLWAAFGYSVVQGYGLTETAPAITVTHPFKVRRGAVGRRLAEVDVRIAPDGEILVRGPVVSPGYFRNPEASAQLFSDGWLHTGDLGRLDEEGNLTFLGRKKEIIVTGEGLNVYPHDVEAVLNQQPEIRESAVIAEEGPEAQVARVHAVLVPALPGGEGLDQAVRVANQRLEPYQRIRGYSVWPEPELPRTASTHKLQRIAIGAWVNRKTATLEMSKSASGRDWREVLAARLHCAPEALQPGVSLDEIGVSSLDRVELLTWLESELHLGIDEHALNAAQTIGDLEKLIGLAVAPETPSRNEELGLSPPAPIPATPERASSPFQYPRWPTAGIARKLRAIAFRLLVFPVLRIHVRLTVEGRENLRGSKRPVLLVANHQSLFDVPSILRALPSHWHSWVAPAMGARDFREFLRPQGTRFRHRRRAYLKYVLTQAFFNGYLLAQEGGVRNALRYTGQLADQGYCPLIFPEGQETPDGKFHPFRPGIGVFVHELGLPVVPIVIQGLFDILPIGAKWPRRGRAHIRIGEEQRFQDADPGEITAKLQFWFEQQLHSEEPLTRVEQGVV